MKLYEYQAKAILAGHGVPVLRGTLVVDAKHAIDAAKSLSSEGPWVVKAQVHAGGRGKAGGVKLAKSLAEVADISKSMLGMTLVTKQTGPAGIPVRKIYIEEGCRIARELYSAVLVDRASQKICVLASMAGGMEIEDLAASRPEAIKKLLVDPVAGPAEGGFELLAAGIGLKGEEKKKFADVLSRLYDAFIKEDALLVEVNPMVFTEAGDVIALDAKLTVDDNALFRHPDTKEVGLSYIALNGNIGCMVNGAGLAMATMDIIKLYGGSPANFLDVGGSATVERITAAFRIMMENPRISAILVNIFGGIMQCDVAARGLVEATRALGITLPIVVRMHGTHEVEAHRILKNSGLSIVSADTMSDAAQKAVAAAKGELK